MVRIADLDDPCRATLAELCGPGGPWQRLFPGVLLLRRGVPSRSEWQRAALLYAGAGSVLTGLDALVGAGLGREPAPDDPVHVLVPHPRRRHGSHRVLVERTHRMPAPVNAPIPRAPVARAVIDHCRRHRADAAARSIVTEVLRRGLCAPADLEAELRFAWHGPIACRTA